MINVSNSSTAPAAPPVTLPVAATASAGRVSGGLWGRPRGFRALFFLGGRCRKTAKKSCRMCAFLLVEMSLVTPENVERCLFLFRWELLIWANMLFTTLEFSFSG